MAVGLFVSLSGNEVAVLGWFGLARFLFLLFRPLFLLLFEIKVKYIYIYLSFIFKFFL